VKELPMQQIVYSGLADYLGIVDLPTREAFLLYRGQDCNNPLLPKIARADPKRETTSIEQEMLAELRRRGSLYLSHHATDDWDLLVRAQHYGMATRLLDWTSNPLVALWFACWDEDREEDGYVYVLIVTGDLLLDAAKEQNPFSRPKTRVLKPIINNPRIIAQGGWFTAHTYSKKNKKFVPLEKNRDTSTAITEVCIPGSEKLNILKSLNNLGINHASLFPDLNGLCLLLNWEYLSD
jgi:hypothetical protein